MSPITASRSKCTSTYRAIVVRRVLVPARPRIGYPEPYHLLIVACPFCPNTHTHGDGGYGPDVKGSYGERSPHCPDPYRVPAGLEHPAGYEVVLGTASEVAA